MFGVHPAIPPGEIEPEIVVATAVVQIVVGGGGHPVGKAEAQRRMKMLYEKVLKKFINKFDVYRSYKKDNMKTIQVIKYKLGDWHQAKLQ